MTESHASSTSPYTLVIATPGGSTDDRSLTVAGSLVDIAGAPASGRSVEIDEAGVALGTATVGVDGLWSVPILLGNLGANTIVARIADGAAGSVTSAPVVLTLDTVLSPTSSLLGIDDSTTRVFPPHDAEVSGSGGARTFVFRPHPGHAVIDRFALSGVEADRLSLPLARFGDLAGVLRHTTMVGNDAVIHLSPHDSVTLVDVSKAALRAHSGAVSFHG